MPTDSRAGNNRRITYLEALAEALDQEMARDPDVLVLGEDIGGEFGGAFKATKGLWQKYGEDRVINTPMAELGFTGMATGMALAGLRPVIEMQFADFISTAFDAIVQYAASTHYIWQGAVPWTIRAPADGGTSSGPFHSQNPEAWFAHVPGLKVICPGTPADVKGLLTSAIRDNNPVIFFESKTLYRSLRGPVPPGEHLVPIGKARQARPGADLTIITYGAMLQSALAAAEELAGEDIEAAVLDLRTVKPLDTDQILESVKATGKALIVHAANRMMGCGAEVAALIAEECFEYLDAPVRRLGGLDTPVPFSPPLEQAYRPDADRIAAAARDLDAW
ncbi:MAG: alpha-ketoacid dehydrogenase subunit beta [Caldilineaceae bacterium SB0662_bin_9]|uniref:Alpha-ketoacid dehydrogenase subunit beta n=1 Tax=Caldilineaceae bacterium SB0662_bin_9 TaxID=2605258 RepID=A0A6B1DSC9_9CHLR|nr:alpha-ketoacid dehydrogenase subunit beta [Caldilineaceae bacterium]MXZ24171.1 alpha-ketoacid dehydrogenase subunit beta [Caldilineaceae bacterium SB0665_bin_21]MXZ42355.1 alpha-ketoacid dehydrogenase subunit beta [Caldilineaceae bacterium SB0666_bin_21]MYA05762.1 alpha-ketoacid dehydrogenase subunit beta [Caldilineaceae bacterium SB0664_bin_22]MYC63561.1 alpha-ketoacid dehydrogenase subunit beta [Caldilineaceae bacterium SB0661_bin_34]MYD89806.1 alpha-ketoacid dehydrogenase subunit beta [C